MIRLPVIQVFAVLAVAVGALAHCHEANAQGSSAGAAAASEPAIARQLSKDETLQRLEVPANRSLRVTGAVHGDKAIVYAVTLAAGESLEARLETRSTSAYFNIIDGADNTGAAIHRGEVDGMSARVTATRPAIYLIQPFLVRAAARRGESANYSIDISRRSRAN